VSSYPPAKPLDHAEATSLRFKAVLCTEWNMVCVLTEHKALGRDQDNRTLAALNARFIGVQRHTAPIVV